LPAYAGLDIIKRSTKVDPKLAADQLQALQDTWRVWGPEAFFRYNIWILGKKEMVIGSSYTTKRKTRLVPFIYNPIQHKQEANLTDRNIFLKARQIGETTWVLCRRILVPTILSPGSNGFLISQNGGRATEHFRIVRRALRWFAAADPTSREDNDLSDSLRANLLHTMYSSRKELVFDFLDSTVSVGSAEVEESAQGITLHHVAGSEVARWPGNAEETLSNIKEAIVLGGTLDLESTANEAAGYFFEEFQRAERGASEFKAHFSPWWEEPSYRIKTAEEIKDLEADERALVKKYRLDMQQIAFRRQKKLSLRYSFDEKYPEDSISAFLLKGSCFFDKDIVRLRLLELMNYTPVAKFAGGLAYVYKKRVKGRKYIIGADVASGKMPDPKMEPDDAKRDASAAKVLDIETGEEVASYLAQVSTVDFALDLIGLGNYYNNAVIAVERGTGVEAAEGGTVILTLSEHAYSNIYRHKEWWKRDKASTKQIVEFEGLPTNKRTRPVILNKLKWAFEEDPELFWDVRLLRQMSVFVRDEKGRPAAALGSHDDLVLASGIAHFGRLVLLNYLDPLSFKSERYQEEEED
jgi:hypothetical protein